MLDVLRRGASTWISKLLLGLLIVSFGVWGIADVFRGFGSTTAYHVGSREIGAAELDNTYQRELQQVSRRIGRPFNKEEALKTGVYGQILNKVVTEATIGEAAKRQGLAVSDDAIRAEILRDPAFKGASGAFDRARFVDLLRANGWNEDIYVVRRRDDLMRAQMIEGLVGGQPAPKVLVEALDQFRNETRTVRYATLAASSLGEIAAPDDTVLKAFHAERARAFRAPETRALTALVLDAKALARPEDVSDDDAKAEYTRQKARFVTPEKRRVRQITFPDAASAEAGLAELKAGTSFEALATARGQKAEDIDLGTMTRAQFVDPVVADAAFALAAPGAVSGVVTGRLATVLLDLVEIVPGSEKSFAEVSTELKSEIAAKRAEGDLLSRHDQIEDALAGGAKLGEVATRFGLKTLELAGVDRDGRLRDGSKPADVPKYDELIKGAFESDVGVENDPIDLGGHGFLWYALTAVDPARDLGFDEVRDRVLAAWRSEETARRLGETAEGLKARLAKGEDFDAVVGGAGLKSVTSTAFKRGETVEGLPSSAVTAAFAGPEGHVAAITAPTGDIVLLRVESVTPSVFFAETDEAKGVAEQAATSIRNALAETWLGLTQKDIGVTANRAVIDRVTGHARD